MMSERELDCSVAQQIFGHQVFEKNRALYEKTQNGDRPLRFYTKDMAAAWEVAEKLGISLIPIEIGMWYALVGTNNGWHSPREFIERLQTDPSTDAGAAVALTAPLVICLAAMKSIESRRTAIAI